MKKSPLKKRDCVVIIGRTGYDKYNPYFKVKLFINNKLIDQNEVEWGGEGLIRQTGYKLLRKHRVLPIADNEPMWMLWRELGYREILYSPHDVVKESHINF